jgi:hypothetical protein
MNQSLSELKAKCQELGLTVKRLGRREAKEDPLSVLRAHFLFHDFPSGCPYEELSPMLCYPYWNLRPHEQEAIWKDGNNWVAQEKINGCRVVLHFVKGVGIFAHSRAISVKTYRRQSLEDHLLFSDFVPDFSAVVDAEALVSKSIDTRNYTRNGEATKSSLHSTTAILQLEAAASKRLQKEQQAPLIIKVFDVTNWEGNDLKKKKLCERLAYIVDFRTAINRAQLEQWFEFPPICFHGKKTFFDKIVQEGGEGIVLKNLNSTYEDSNSRKRNSWVKVKRQVEFDAFVSGFERGRPGTKWENKVACLLFSVCTEAGEHVIAKITSIPWPFRKKISLYDSTTKLVTMHPDVYGKVAHVSGQEIAQRSFRISHPKIVRWCRLMIRDQCAYSLTDIRGFSYGSNGTLPLRIINRSEGSQSQSK